MDITTVKQIMGIKDTKHDEYLATIVPLLIEAVKDYCNNPFKDENGEESIPGGVKVAIAKWCEYNMTNKAGLAVQSMGEVSYTYSYDTAIPKVITGMLKPHRRVKF